MAAMNVGSQSPGSGSQIKRRRYVINAAFQWRYAVMIMVIVFLTSSILTTVLYTMLHRQARAMLLSRGTFVADVRSDVLLSALGFATITAAAVGLWSIIATHRICGPIFIMKRYLLEMASGKLPDVRSLRIRDEFKDVHQAFAQAVEYLRERRKAETQLLGRAMAMVQSSGRSCDEAQRQALERMAAELREMTELTSESAGASVVAPTREVASH